jgi:hypothetical protein
MSALAGLAALGAALGVGFLKRVPDQGEWCVYDSSDPNILDLSDSPFENRKFGVIGDVQPVFCSKFLQEAKTVQLPDFFKSKRLTAPATGKPRQVIDNQGVNMRGSPRRVECNLRVDGFPKRLSSNTLIRDDGLFIGQVDHCINLTGTGNPETAESLAELGSASDVHAAAAARAGSLFDKIVASTQPRCSAKKFQIQALRSSFSSTGRLRNMRKQLFRKEKEFDACIK